MSPKKHRTRHVSEAEAKSYLKKAEEFYQTMLESYRVLDIRIYGYTISASPKAAPSHIIPVP